MRNRITVTIVLLGLVLLIPVRGMCQELPLGVKEAEEKIKALIERVKAAKATGGAQEQDSVKTVLKEMVPDLIPFVLVGKTRKDYVEAIEEARLDKQVGGGDASSGSTSLVSKGSVPAILGFAVENGALQREQGGTTVTFRGNPIGIIQALGDKGFIESYDDDSPSTKMLRRLSFALSFDTGRGETPGTFVGDLKQLSSVSARFDIYNKRDPRNSAYRNRWEDMIRHQGLLLTMTTVNINNYVFLPVSAGGDATLQKWYKDMESALIGASQADVEKVVRAKLKELLTLPLPAELLRLARLFDTTVESFLGDRSKLLKEVANGWILTFEYANTRQVNLPDLSNFKLIYENGLNGRADLTANASLTIFNKKPSGASDNRLRDFQLSSQLDVPLSNPFKSGNFVLSFSGKFQRMVENMTTNTGMMVETKGNIGIGQIKLTIPVKGSGVKIPISVTVANRGDLIMEKSFVKGNIGITFDLDTIFSKLKP